MKRTSQPAARSILSSREIKRRAMISACFESLEQRRLFAGIVSASVLDGNLTIEGDDAANAIVLDQSGLEADQVRITGTGDTAINDQSEPVILSGVTGAVGIRMGDGDDSVSLNDISLAGSLWLNADGGANSMTLNDVQIAENLDIKNRSNLGNAISISNTAVGRDISIDTDAGGHQVVLQSVQVQGSTGIGSGRGDDSVTIDDSTFHGKALIYTGKGDDTVEIDVNGDPLGSPTLFNGRVVILMKHGEDTLQIGTAGQTGNTAAFAGRASLFGGKGHDTLTLDPGIELGQIHVKEFESDSSAPDTTAPTVSATTPADDATGIARNRKITATFSEPMDAATLTDASVTVTSAGGDTIAGTVAYVGTTMTFTPADTLDANTVFTAIITTGAQDIAGNALAENFVWSFTTGATSDSTAPTVLSSDPEDDATDVARNKKIAVIFSETMDALTITAENVTVTGPGGADVAGTVAYVGKTMTFTPAGSLAADSEYTVTITTGAQDLAGNALAADAVSTFTTGSTADIGAPTVVLTSPSDGQSDVALNKTVAATFSESMDPLSIVGNFEVTGPGNTPVAGVMEYDAVSKIASFNPSEDLAADATYTATITGGSNGAKDLAGNAMTDDAVWTFTTGTQLAQAPIVLGRASPFAVMATASIESTGATQINGDVGLNPGSAQGIPPAQVNGEIHVNDQAIIDAQEDLLAAYNDAVGRSVSPVSLPGNMGGLTFTPGLYTNSSSVMIQGAGPANNVTLDAQGDPNAIFIFQMGSTLTTGPGAQVILAGGAKADNIFWQVGTSATLDTTTIFKGNILAAVTITVNTGSVVEGRLLGGSNSDGSVTVNASTVTVPAV